MSAIAFALGYVFRMLSAETPVVSGPVTVIPRDVESADDSALYNDDVAIAVREALVRRQAKLLYKSS